LTGRIASSRIHIGIESVPIAGRSAGQIIFMAIAGAVLLFVVVRAAKTAFDALRLSFRGQRPRAAAPGLLAELVLWGVRVIKCTLPWRCGAPLCCAGRAAAASIVVLRQLGARANQDCRR